MNLGELPIPPTSEQMIKTCNSYYHSFYIEMVRMSNVNLNDYVSKFLNLVTELTKSPGTSNVIRASIGVVALHRFGYNDFHKLSRLFDRLLPQTDPEYVKFTSWCAGQLIHHPDASQLRYSSHLVQRLIGWTRSKGRRSRPLAGAYLLHALSVNAGSTVVFSFHSIQSTIWQLVSHPSTLVLQATASAVFAFTRAFIRYGRSELKEYMAFFDILCTKLLSFSDPIREYASLIIFEQLISSNPDYFTATFPDLYSNIVENSNDEPMLVQGAAYLTIASLSRVDPKYFLDNVVDNLFEQTDTVLLEFPREIVTALSIMCESIPEYMEQKIDNLKDFANELINVPKEAFHLLTVIVEKFGEKVYPIQNELILQLLKTPITQEYKDFIIASAKYQIKENIVYQNELVTNRLIENLKSDNPTLAILIISEADSTSFTNHCSLFDSLAPLLSSLNPEIRRIIPKAMVNILEHCKTTVTKDSFFKLLFQRAMYDTFVYARIGIMTVVRDNCRNNQELFASAEYMQYFKFFANDDSATVRQIAFQTLELLYSINPIGVSSIVRTSLLDAFFVIRNVAEIRTRSRIMRTIPDLVKAAQNTIKVYTGGIMSIALEAFKAHSSIQTFDNFLEVNAYTQFLIGIMDTLSLIAPIDPNVISEHAEYVIMILCSFLVPETNRTLALSVLKLLLVLLSPPASTVAYRAQAAQILATCSSFLAATHSRKVRIALLKVLGVLGVLEIHQKPLPTSCAMPGSIDDSILRQFFHPTRDDQASVDDSLLLEKSSSDRYYASVAANSLLEIFNDDNLKDLYTNVVHALVLILQNPKMHMLVYFDAFIERLLKVMKTANDSQMKDFLPQYSNLILNSAQNTAPFLKRSLDLIKERFSKELAPQFLDVICSFLIAIKDGFFEHASKTTCMLVSILDSAKTTSVPISCGVLKAFSLLGLIAHDLTYVIVSNICDVIQCDQTLYRVRLNALQTLITLNRELDLSSYFCSIIRSATHGILYEDEKMRSTSLNLVITMLKVQGKKFLDDAQCLIHLIKEKNLETQELAQVISDVEQNDSHKGFRRLVNKEEATITGKRSATANFSEEAITTRAMTPNLGICRHTEEWFRTFVLTMITNSPSSHIRFCITLATSHYPLALKLFNAAFHSCWQKMAVKSKEQVISSFREILKISDYTDTIPHEIIKLIVFMHKIEDPLDIPSDELITAAMKHGGVPLALRLEQKVLEDPLLHSTDYYNRISKLINIYVELGNWPDAIGLWKSKQSKLMQIDRFDMLTHLKMWDQVMPFYEDRFNKTHDFESFLGLIESLAAMAMWPKLMSFYNVFKELQTPKKKLLAEHFSEAALHINDWSSLKDALQYAQDDSSRSIALMALNALHQRDYRAAESYISKGFALIASRPINFWGDNRQIHQNTVFQCQELIEIDEMKQWLQNKNVKQIEEVWNERLKTTPRDFDLWFNIIANRASLTEVLDDNLIKFFQLKSITLGTKIHANAFDSLFPTFDFNHAPDLHKVCYVVAHWNMGEKTRALDEMETLTQNLRGILLQKCQLLYANWLLEMDDSFESLQKAYMHLERAIQSKSTPLLDEVQRTVILQAPSLPFRHSIASIQSDNISVLSPISSDSSYTSTASFSPQPQQFPATPLPFSKVSRHFSSASLQYIIPTQIFEELTTNISSVEMLRKWSDINAALIAVDPDNLTLYVTNAIDALTQCSMLSPSFPDVVQLLNLFFEYANQNAVFNSTAHKCIEKLPPKLLLKASPQIQVQLSHQTENVAAFVHDVVLNLLLYHYHTMIFSVILFTKSNNQSRARAADDILKEFMRAKPEVYNEIMLIRSTLLRVTVTWHEKVMQYLTDVEMSYNPVQPDRLKQALTTISKFSMPEKAKCLMHVQFQQKYQSNLRELQTLINLFKPDNPAYLKQLANWCYLMKLSLSEELNSIKMIQLSAVCPELGEKSHFQLAVPGTYKPNKPIILIDYFVGEFSVYQSKQVPKDVLLKGEDGNFYQYLLKGHEDLRLDERIMQFFRLVNSFLRKETCFHANVIQVINVIPLSLEHGLVQWVPGTDTLRRMVEAYRAKHNISPMLEFDMLEDLSCQYDTMEPIQKCQLLEKVFKETSDTDIADSFWTIASSAEMWLKQVNTFAISTAITSAVGYIIGLGDRHPSNLLIDRNSGKVVHIDFGDCFERAQLRQYLPEVVPFRLTRMIVRAMGPAGVDGIFMSSFINMMTLLRDNIRVLVTVLSIFVHEPLVDPDETETQLVSKSSSNESFRVSRIAPIHPSICDQTVRSSVEMRKRVHQKLAGNDLDVGEQLTVEEQAKRLVQMATDPYRLSHMYSGWCPFW